MSNQTTRQQVYDANKLIVQRKNQFATAEKVPYGANVAGVYFDGYPEIIKGEETQPSYAVKLEKDVKIPMRDGAPAVRRHLPPGCGRGREVPRSAGLCLLVQKHQRGLRLDGGIPAEVSGHAILGRVAGGVQLQLHRAPGLCPYHSRPPRHRRFRGVRHKTVVQQRRRLRHGGVDRGAALVQREGGHDRSVGLLHHADPRGGRPSRPIWPRCAATSAAAGPGIISPGPPRSWPPI